MADDEPDLAPSRSWEELIATSTRRGTYLRRRRRAVAASPVLLVALVAAAVPLALGGAEKRDVLDVATQPSPSPRALGPEVPEVPEPDVEDPLLPQALPPQSGGSSASPARPRRPRPGGADVPAEVAEVPQVRKPVGPRPGTDRLRRIVFSRGTQYEVNQRNFEVMTAAEDGTGEQQLTTSLTHDEYDTTWSPDGARIAFAKDEWSGVYGDQAVGGIFVMGKDGSGARRLTRVHCPALTGVCWDEAPAWSPDGRTIAFHRYGDTGVDSRSCGATAACSAIWMVGADGTRLRQVTSGWRPDWSPDGRRLVFADSSTPGDNAACETVPGSSERCQSYLYVSNADGSGRRALGVAGSAPRWSPDGSRVVFELRRGSASDVGVLDLTTGEVDNLTPESTSERAPAWSRDGRDVIVVKNRDVYIVRVEDQEVSQVTATPQEEESPRFAPA